MKLRQVSLLIDDTAPDCPTITASAARRDLLAAQVTALRKAIDLLKGKQ